MPNEHDHRILDDGFTIRANGYQHRVYRMLNNVPAGIRPFSLEDWETAYADRAGSLVEAFHGGSYCPFPKPPRWNPDWFAWYRPPYFPIRL